MGLRAIVDYANFMRSKSSRDSPLKKVLLVACNIPPKPIQFWSSFQSMSCNPPSGLQVYFWFKKNLLWVNHMVWFDFWYFWIISFRGRRRGGWDVALPEIAKQDKPWTGFGWEISSHRQSSLKNTWNMVLRTGQGMICGCRWMLRRCKNAARMKTTHLKWDI